MATKHHERFTAALFDSSPEALFAMDMKGMITYANTRWRALLGFKGLPLENTRLYDLIDDSPVLLKSLILDHRYEICIETRLKKKNGELFWGRLGYTPLTHPVMGEETFFTGSIRDISHEKLLYDKLEESDCQEDAILEALGEGVIIMNRDLEIEKASSGFLKMTGKPLREVLGRPCFEISHGYSSPCFEMDSVTHPCPVKMAFEKKIRTSAIHIHEGADRKQRKVEVTAIPIIDHTGAVQKVIETIRDVTEEMALEEMAQRVEKIEAIGNLAGGIAHDLNNILTPIMGYVDISLGRLGAGHPISPHLLEIKKAAQRAARLVRQILAFSRRQIMEKAVVNMNDVIKDTEMMLRSIVPENISLVLKLDKGLWPILADAGQIEQVLLNLVLNAKDAIVSKSGTIIVETQNITMGPGHVCSVCGQDIIGQFALLMVSDDGMGMSQEVMGRIFEPFYTTKDIGEGTGLGLSTVLGIMHQHDGHINVYSEPGKGSTFKAYFPRFQGSSKDGPISRHEAPPKSPLLGTTRPLKILVAEDNADVRSILDTMLRHLGHSSVIVPNGTLALQALREPGQTFDVLITDIVMPDMSGDSLAFEVRKDHPGLPIIFISGYSKNALPKHYFMDERIVFIQKPFTVDQLREKLLEFFDPGLKLE